MNQFAVWRGSVRVLVASFLALVLSGAEVCAGAGPPRPPARPRPVRARPPVRLPMRRPSGELPAGPETPPEKLPAQYFASLGQIHIQHSQWSKAEECFREAYAKEKDAARRAEHAYRLGQLHMRKKEYDKALPLVEEAVKHAPADGNRYEARRYRTTLASLYEKANKPEKAEALYQQWAKEASKGYERQMAQRELLRLWQRAGKLDAAVAKYEAALKGKPNDKDTLELLRLVYTSIKPDPDKALAISEKLVAAQPDDRDAAMQLLSAYERARKHDKAIELLKKLIETQPDQREFLSTRLIYLYVQSGQKGKAKQMAEEMLAKGPKTSNLHGRVASIYLQLGMTDEALAQYGAAAQLAKRDSERERYLLSAAHAARRAKKYKEAEELVKNLVKSKSKAVVSQAKRLLFEIYEEQNKLDQLQISPKR